MAAGAKSTATGNLITGEGTQTGSVGADIATGGHITEIAGKGGDDSNFAGGKLSVMGEYGKLSVDAEGNYSYQANKGVENVRDRFTYTLADSNGATDTAALIIEIGKTPFAVKADAQQVIVGPDGVVTLPAGVELSDVHVVGRNLVVDLPDGTQMIIIDGAVFVPQLVLGGVEVPSTNIAALLIGQEVAPAAGETPPSSGGNFGTPPPPLDPGVPLGDLIPPTEYGYTPPDVREIGDILDREPSAGTASAQLDDDAQEGGNPGGIGDVEPTLSFVSGSLPGSGGDGALTWDLLASGNLPAGFSFQSQGNGDIWILQGADHVLTITINPATGGYTVTQLQAIDHPAGGDENDLSFIIQYSVTDQDGDVAIGNLTVNVDDDTPVVHVEAGPDANVILTTDDADTDGDPTDSDTDSTSANFGGVFSGTTVSFGADGSGPGTSSTYTLAVTGQNSGLTSHGATINLFVVGGVVVGTTAASAGAINTGNTIFTVATTNTGVVTLTQLQQIDHPIGQDPTPSGAPFADQFISMVDGFVTLTRAETVVDGDGDQVTGSATVNIGANLHFTDDGPSIGLADHGEPTLNVDETNLGTNDSASFAANFSANFGADGPAAAGSITYALGVNAGATGLFDTATGAQVVLTVVNGQVVGTAGVGGPTVFVVSVDANGVVTLDQQRAVVHDISSDPDTSEAATTIPDNLITLTATAHDFDGDTSSQSLNIGSNLSFHDDGPTAASGTTGQNVSVDETAGVQGDSNDTTNAGVIALFAGVADAGSDPDMSPQYGSNAIAVVNSTGSVYGADGAGTTVFSLDVSSAGVDSGLDTTEGFDILLFKEGNLIVGRVDGGAHDGEAAFAIAIDPATGVVSMVEYLSIDHPVNPNPDDSLSIDNGAILATVTVTDKDGDFDSSSVGIGSHIQFQDDGPTVAPTLNVQATVTVDETLPSNTPGIDTGLIQKGDDPDLSGGLAIGQGNSGSAIVDPHAVFGADGPAASGSISYALSILNVSSGLTLTDGSPVNLQLVNGNIVGVVASGTFAGQAAFAISINSTTGVVTLEQYLSLDHPVNPNPNDPLSFGSNVIGVTVTATDGDGDPVTSPAVDIGGQLTFLDDGPSANNDTDTTSNITDQADGNVITGVGTNEGAANHDVPGADGFGAITNLVGFNGSTDGNPSGGFDVSGQWGTLHMDAFGQYTYTRTGGAGGATDTFTYTYVDGDGDTVSATLTITLADNTPQAGNVDVGLDDDALAGGNPGGIGDDPNSVNATGFLPGSGGDAPLAFGVLLTGAPAGFTYVSGGAGVVLVQQGGVTVLTITVNSTTGAYSVVQNAPINHAAGSDENNQAFTINYTVTDSDNDVAPGTISISVDDDTPTVAANAGVQLDDDALAGGNAGGVGDDANATNVSGTLSHSYGADGAGSMAYLTTGAPAGFSYALQGNGDLWVMQGATHVLTLTINATTGAYTVSQVAPIDHPAGLDENNVSFTISYSVTDHDGDSVNGSIVVNVDDDTPTATANAAVQLDDDALTGGNAGGVGDVNPDTANTSGTLAHSYGADGAGSMAYLTTGAPAGFSYALQGNGDLWVMQGATHVLTLTINATTGAYTVSQVAPIDHAAGLDENNVSFTISYSVTDHDGDSVTGSIVVDVDDDTPTVAANAAVQLDDDALAGGNAGGVGDDANATNVSGTLSHSYGADGAGSMAYLTTGAPAGFSYALQGNGDLWVMQGATHVLTLTINATTGAYTVSQVAPIDHPAGLDENNVSFTISYSVTDHDGDSVNGSIVVNVDDDTPTATVVETVQTVSVDESVGIQVDSNDTTSAGVIALFAGVTNTGTDTHLPQYAQSVSGLVASTGSSYGADGAGNTVFSLNVSAAGVDSGLNTTDGHDILLYKEGNLIVGRVSGGADDGKAALAIAINPATGVVSIVEYLSIQHTNTANPDDSVSIADGAVLAVVTVTDSDGDSATNQVGIGSQIQFQDSGPVMTTVQNMNIQNSGDVAHTAAFAFNLGADGANIATNDVITNVTGGATVGGVAVTNWILTPGAENATTASYSFSFDYPIGGGNTAHETGTLVFDKVAGTYTVDLANPIQGVTTILQTATGTLFQGYEPGTSNLDGSQPEISVTQIQDLAGTANDIYVQFTSVAEPSSGTGDNNLEFSNWVPGANNPAPVNGGGDTTWNAGQLFNQVDSWVSTSNDANGVAGDTIQGGEVLDFNLVQGANPTGILADPSTYAQASSMFLKFDGIGSGEDMIVILKVYDTVAHTYSTVALMVQNSDIQKGPGSGPGIYSGITLDNNDGLIVIEPNDYQQGNTNLVIVGAQISGSDEGLTGTALDFNYGGVLGVASTGTQAFSTDTNDGPFKISSIGFTTVSTTPQNAQLDFNVTVTDGDGDSITQAISATVTPAVDSVSAATIPAANTTVAPVVLDLNGDGVQFLAADAGVRFDYNGDGVKEATAWAGPTDGILVLDANGNGTVDGAGEFVFGSGSVTDLQGLRALYGDTLDANDADFAKFGVWQDANSNGVVDAGEYKSLTAAGITSINLVSDNVTYTAAGGDVVVAGSSTYTNADGSTGTVADASFYVGRAAVDEQTALSSSSSSIAIAAAVAAAGLAASQPAAASPADEADHGQTVADAAASVGPAVVAAADDASESRSALSNEAKEAADDVVQAASSGHSDASAESSHSLDGSQAAAAASSSHAPANDQGPAADAAAASPVAPAVAMVSAAALQAAGLDGNAQHSGSVEKIVAEALGQGNGHGAIDAILDAFHGGNGSGAAIANLASAGANAVSAWDMASNGGSAGATEMLMKVGAEMLHHDMVLPTHNG
ncbi:DUF5801 repeats-in-toxin domain-containing protein [Sphingomonas sp.]|uniref:DUF5801 repeats-in-toxin domain-containing protein n=1 Tax=Sphingomonas sp. TaxID=28214 RepID=UPI0025CF911D|nr:DUF5801 repeats-in-toxin domain-containing protein [Sphingomonas sp.]